jgi:uncharacterized membrane protein
MSVLDRLGAALCDLVPLHLRSGVLLSNDKIVLVVPGIDYDGLADAMFHLIRQSATASVSVLIRMLEVFTSVVSAEHNPDRICALQRHADLILSDARRNISAPSDLYEIHVRYRGFVTMRRLGPIGYLCADSPTDAIAE